MVAEYDSADIEHSVRVSNLGSVFPCCVLLWEIKERQNIHINIYCSRKPWLISVYISLLTSSIIFLSVLTSAVSSVIPIPLSSVNPFIRQEPLSREPPSPVCLSWWDRLLVLWASFRSVRVTPCGTIKRLHICQQSDMIHPKLELR